MSHAPHSDDPPEGLSIGRLAEETGIAVDTLRVWERRYGYPVPTRLPSGHRRYGREHVRRLRRVAEGLARGHRPSALLRLDERELDRLLQEPLPETAGAQPFAMLLESIRGFRRRELRDALLRLSSQRAPEAFLVEIVAPLLDLVGRQWADGTLQVRHEHFASETLEDVLRSIRTAIDGTPPPAENGLMLLTTLPGEKHDLGLQMAALSCAVHGIRCRILGPETPLDEIVAAVRELGAGAVGVSVSLASGGPATDRVLRDLRSRLPTDVELVVGGAGARGARRGVQGATYVDGLEALGAWLDHW